MLKQISRAKVKKGRCKFCHREFKNLNAHIERKHLKELVKSGKRKMRSHHVRR